MKVDIKKEEEAVERLIQFVAEMGGQVDLEQVRYWGYTYTQHLEEGWEGQPPLVAKESVDKFIIKRTYSLLDGHLSNKVDYFFSVPDANGRQTFTPSDELAYQFTQKQVDMFNFSNVERGGKNKYQEDFIYVEEVIKVNND